MSILEIEHLSAGYIRGAPVVRDLTMQVGLGEVVTVIGPNGSGKSTLLKALMGLVRIEAGTIHLDGSLVSGGTPESLVKMGVAYVPQEEEVFPTLTVEENLKIGGYLLPRHLLRSRLEVMYDLYPTLRRFRGRHAAKLSGGERKLVSIGRALMGTPRLLVLDEPSAGLSEALSNELFQRDISQLKQAGIGVLMVEQKALSALDVSSWAYLLVQGSVKLDAPASSASSLAANGQLGSFYFGLKGS